MKTLTYTQLLNRTLDLYMIEHFTEAYEFITEQGPLVSGNPAQIYNFRYTIACKAGLFDLAMAIFEEAVESKGFWYGYQYLTTDEDLIPLRQNTRFKELAEICKKREQVARLNSAPVLKMLEARSTDQGRKPAADAHKPGLLVALHGNQENMAIAEPYWSMAIDHGYTLALPQSSQIEFTDAFDWDAIEKGAAELKSHIDAILSGDVIISEGAIDPNNIIIGSFSAGAGPALYAVLKGMINARTLIFVAPWLPEIDQWTAMLDLLKTKEIPCHILCGGQDEDCLESSQALVKQLKKRQIPYTFQLIDGLDHDFPDTFAEDLIKFLKS